MVTKNIQNGRPNHPKSSPNGAKRKPGAPKNRKKKDPTKNTPALNMVPVFLIGKMTNTVPSWVPKPNQNRHKIDAKIYEEFDAFRNRCLKRIWWTREGEMDASWDPNRSKIDANFEKTFYQNVWLNRSENQYFHNSGG